MDGDLIGAGTTTNSLKPCRHAEGVSGMTERSGPRLVDCEYGSGYFSALAALKGDGRAS